MGRLALFFSLLLFSLVLTGCKKETSLLSNLDQYRTNKIISTLQQHGISSTKVANKKGNAYTIMIDAAKLAEATTILNAVGPFTPAHAPQDPCAFKGLIATPSEERACRKFRLQSDLEDTLSQIDGIISAEVHIVMSDNPEDSLKTEFLSSSAAIFIKHRADVNLSIFKTNIKRLVEKSIPGLTYDKVSLVLIAAGALSDEPFAIYDDGSSTLVAIIILLGFLLLLSIVAFAFKEKLLKLLSKDKNVEMEKE